MPIDNRTWPVLLRIYNRGRFFKHLVSGKNRLPTPPVPLGARLKLAWHGFLPDKYHLYDLRENDYRLYCSDWQVLMTQTIDGHYAAILYDKLLFETVVGQVANVPGNFALVDRGKVTWLANHTPPDQDLLALVRQREKVILKPRNSDGGKGVHLLAYHDGAYRCDDREVGEQELSRMFSEARESIVVEFVEQSAFASKLYPNSVNTIRFMTFLDGDSGKPFIAVAGMRIGCDRSAPKDNYHAGGIFVDRIDLATGRFGRAIKARNDGPGFEWIDRHPETGVVFEDQVIPDWENVCSSLLETAEQLPYLPLVAWDVALLEDGISILEGNHWSMLSDFQCSSKLLEDPRVRAFFRHHNML